MWVAGHNHRNTILPIASPDPGHPEYGFWVVETASLRDFPQEFRTFEITRYSDELVGIKTVCVDVDVEGDVLAKKSRSYSIAAAQMSGMTDVASRMRTGWAKISAEEIRLNLTVFFDWGFLGGF